MIKPKTNFEDASALAKKGFKLFPLHHPKEGRCSCGNSGCNSIGKHPVFSDWKEKATNDPEVIEQWWKWDFPNANIAILTGEDAGLLVVDVDGEEGKKSFSELVKNSQEPGELAITPFVYTGKGFHVYLKHPTGHLIKNKVGLKPGIDIRSNNGYIVAPGSVHNSGHVYSVDEHRKLPDSLKGLPEVKPGFLNLLINENRVSSKPITTNDLKEGSRNATLASMAGSMRRKGFDEDAIAVALLEQNKNCNPPLDEDEVKTIAKSISGYAPSLDTSDLELPEEALYGPIGDYVKLLAPNTEASKASILSQVLILMGNIIGRKSYVRVEGSDLYPNEFMVLVAESAKGRKGTSWNRAKQILGNKDDVGGFIDQVRYYDNIKNGASSGEGIINHVRDGSEENGITGVNDKRLLLCEGEFGRILQVNKREGSTLSAVLRDAWDSNDLSILTKNNPTKASEPHISMIGHITAPELKRLINSNDLFNGFANRFLWVHSKRSQLLPMGKEVNQKDIERISKRILDHIPLPDSDVKRYYRDEEAKKLFSQYYFELESKVSGNHLIDSLGSRSSAHLLKISLIYATVDGTENIKSEHIRAAKAFWDYCEHSINHIFKDHFSCKDTRRVMEFLRSNSKASRTEIRDLFNRNKSQEEIERIRLKLSNLGKIEVIEEGKKEIWTLIRPTT
ncbi:MAG: bifunctional DNA primase/polymerase [Flavobacteriaceae bacterium]|nr:bifunctional DNA primase/polymerase [Flavobacteriaceae bacterium]